MKAKSIVTNLILLISIFTTSLVTFGFNEQKKPSRVTIQGVKFEETAKKVIEILSNMTGVPVSEIKSEVKQTAPIVWTRKKFEKISSNLKIDDIEMIPDYFKNSLTPSTNENYIAFKLKQIEVKVPEAINLDLFDLRESLFQQIFNTTYWDVINEHRLTFIYVFGD